MPVAHIKLVSLACHWSAFFLHLFKFQSECVYIIELFDCYASFNIQNSIATHASYSKKLKLLYQSAEKILKDHVLLVNNSLNFIAALYFKFSHLLGEIPQVYIYISSLSVCLSCKNKLLFISLKYAI